MYFFGRHNAPGAAFLVILLVSTSTQSTPNHQPRDSQSHSSPFRIQQGWSQERTHEHVTLLTRVRDGVVNAIWRVSQESSDRSGSKPTTSPSGVVSRYKDDVVLRFTISSEEEAKALRDATNVLFLDVWESTADWADIRLATDVVPSLLGLLPASLQNAHTPLMPSLAAAIYDTYPFTSSDTPASYPTPPFTPSLHIADKSPQESSLFFRDYQPLSVIYPWLRLLTSLFPTHARLVNIGLSYEGREIPALRLGAHPTNDDSPLPPRKTILVVGGIHAREWISTSSVNYAAYSLITSYGKSPFTTTSLLETFDFVFIPTINPDGYAHTWTTDRLWRKNRQQTALRFCPGIDLDHTFPFQWDGDTDGDTENTSNPCSESFAGEEPFDGHEARVLSNWMKNETESGRTKFVAFLDFHSYSQQVLYPYAYSCEATPRGLENLEELAIGIAKAIRLTGGGEDYGVTSACEGSVSLSSSSSSFSSTLKSQPQPHHQPHHHLMIEPRGGSALDYMYHTFGIRLAYQIKLRDTGAYGFLLPKNNIVPTGEEALAAVEYVGRWLKGDKGIEGVEEVEEEEEEKGKGEAAEDVRFPIPRPGQREGVGVGVNLSPIALEGDVDGDEDKEEEEDEPVMELRRRTRRRR